MMYIFQRPDLFDGWDKPDWEAYNGNIILYGAGKAGYVIAYALEKRGINYIAWCDSSAEKQGKTYLGHSVISPETLNNKYKNCIIIIATSHYAAICQTLNSFGFTEIYDAHSVLLTLDFNGFTEFYSMNDDFDNSMYPAWGMRIVDEYLSAIAIKKNRDTTSLMGLGIFITQRCSLHCKHCSYGIPYINGHRDFNTQKILESINLSMSAFNYIMQVHILGGEAFLHPDIVTIVKHSLAFDNPSKVCVVTNGTIMPDKGLIEVMKHPRFHLEISNYGDKSKKIDELIEMCKNNGINYENTNYKFWRESAKFKPVNTPLNEENDETKAKFARCTSAPFPTIYGGIFCLCCSSCTPIFMFKELQTSNNCVVLENNPHAVKDMQEFMKKTHDVSPLDLCYYCSGSPNSNFDLTIPVAEQASKQAKLKYGLFD